MKLTMPEVTSSSVLRQKINSVGVYTSKGQASSLHLHQTVTKMLSEMHSSEECNKDVCMIMIC